MHEAILQGLDWATSDVWVPPPSLSRYRPILLGGDQFCHEALNEESFALLAKLCLHTELLQLFEAGISPQAA